MQAVTPQSIEEHVLANPWFDRHGLLVACHEGRPGGYERQSRRARAGGTLAGLRGPVDVKQMQIHRGFKVMGPKPIVPDKWWEASMWALDEGTRFDLVLSGAGEAIISAVFWDVQPL